MFDVAVIGGGPAGSQAAFRLSRLGHSVAVIEAKDTLDSPVCCTGIVSEECLRAFSIDESVVLRHVNSARLYSPSGKELIFARQAPQAAVLDRQRFNCFMAKRAADAGATYYYASLVATASISGTGVTLVCHQQTGTTEIRSKAAIVASGSRPPPVGFSLGRLNRVTAGAQAEVTVPSERPVEVYFGSVFSPGLFAWLVPTTPGKALAGLLAFRRPAEHLQTFLSWLKGQGKIIDANSEVRLGTVPLKPLPRAFTDRVLVVGTAAGLVKPITGGGIYFGLLSADIASSVLHGAFDRGDLSARSLSAYGTEVKALLERELKAGSRARAIYEQLSDRQIDRLFDIMIDQDIANLLLSHEDVTFDWHSSALRHLFRETTLAKLFKGAKTLLLGS